MNLLGVVVTYQQSFFFPDRHGNQTKKHGYFARFASHSFIWSTMPEKKVALFTVYNFCRIHFEVIWGHLPIL